LVRRNALVAVVAVVMLAACSCSTRSPFGSSKPWSDPKPPGAGGIAADWRPCPEVPRELLGRTPANLSFDCATVAVPQDWNTATDGKASNGKTFDIALLRARATDQRNRIGSLLVDPGGPGGSGVDIAVYLSSQLPAEVMRRFDLVGFDPRGVGRSNAVKCFSDTELDDFFGADPDPVSDADFQAIAAAQGKMAGACASKYGDSLRLFSTEQAARDMDLIRGAVGDDKLNYLGYSYGTLLGAVYAELFPTHIRAMVLDGAIDPVKNSVDLTSDQTKGFERAFDNFATWCRTNASKCPIGPDARATVVSTLAAARQSPATGAGGRKATAGWVMTAVAASLYSQETWAEMAKAIDEVRRGDARRLFTLADSYADRNAQGHYSNLFDAFLTITCTDDPTTISTDKVRQLQGAWRTQYPLFGASSAMTMLVCSQWQGGRDPFPTGKAVGAPPIVVVGTTGDPATPYEQTAKLAEMLGVGVVLTWQGEGHTAFPQTRCINDAVTRYLVDLKVPAASTTCPAS
jgi:pimeloyl-ACP methyl ester carboxylesterase